MSDHCLYLINLSHHYHNAVVHPRGIRKTIQAKLEYATLPTMNKSCNPLYDRVCTPWVTCTINKASNSIRASFPNLELRHYLDGTGLSTRRFLDDFSKTQGVMLTVSEIFLKQQYHLFLGDNIYMANMDTTDM